MRIAGLAVLGITAILAACATTPRQQCEWPIRSQLGTVNEEIRDTRRVLQRGYRLVPAQFPFGAHFCMDAFGNDRPCLGRDDGPRFDRRPVSRAGERAKLEALQGERLRLSRALAQCAVQYPE